MYWWKGWKKVHLDAEDSVETQKQPRLSPVWVYRIMRAVPDFKEVQCSFNHGLGIGSFSWYRIPHTSAHFSATIPIPIPDTSSSGYRIPDTGHRHQKSLRYQIPIPDTDTNPWFQLLLLYTTYYKNTTKILLSYADILEVLPPGW